jgi:glycosyltransferase involved in cell wall biosynthesis
LKVIIQIPCFNEEATLGITLRELPRTLPGVDTLEWLVIDDGSTDGTVEVAIRNGVDHVVSLPRNKGLANAFRSGIEACLEARADIIVNTDADNQYCADDIGKLVAPIVCGKADLVVGCRPIGQVEHFSPLKKALQKLGSAVVRMTSRTDVADATSGFRAISRDAALKLNIFGEYTYTLEMLIQAGQRGMVVHQVPIRINGDLRPSRLVKSIRSYVFRSMGTIFRIFVVYRPFRFFMALGSVPLMLSFVLVVRWLYLRATVIPITGHSHVPSLVVAGVSALFGFQLCGMALIADLLAANRKILEELQFEGRRRKLAQKAIGKASRGEA